MRSSMRKLVNMPYEANTDPLQLGGKRRQQVIFGAQGVRHFLQHAKSKGLSVGIVFADIASAFYTVIREVALGASTSDIDIATVVRRLGLGPEVMPQLHSALRGASCYADLGATTACQSYLRLSLEHTWFGVSSKHFVATTKGSRPGDSWADIVFNVLFSAILKGLKEQLTHQGVLLALPVPSTRTIWPGTVPYSEPQPTWQTTWADDLALLLRFTSPTRAPFELAHASSALLIALGRYGMRATIGEGKTEALVLLRGKGALQVRRKLFACRKPTIPVLTEDNIVQIPSTTAYKHLGGWITSASNMMAELRHRVTKAKAAYWRIAQSVLRNRKLDLVHRLQVFRATVMATLLWGAGAWPWLSQQEFRFFQVSVWDLYRLMMPSQFIDGMRVLPSHIEIMQTLKLPHPEDLLSEARARHLLALMKHAPDDVWALVHVDELSLTAYQNAVRWIWQACRREHELPSPENWEPWQCLICEKPSLWKRICTKSARRWRNHRLLWDHVWVWKEELHLHFWVKGFWKDPLPETTHRCLICKIDFSQYRAWFLHAHCKHDYRSIAGRATQGKFCPQCDRLYPTPRSLHHHLRYNASCRTYFWLHRGDVIAAPFDDVQLHPQCPWLPGNGQEEASSITPFDPDCDNLKADLQLTLRNFVPPENEENFVEYLEAELWGVICVALPYTTIVAAFTQWTETLAASCDPHLLETLDRLRTKLLNPFADRHTVDEIRPKAPADWLTLQWSAKAFGCRTWNWLPRELVFLHFYSGHRRSDDVQMCLEALSLPDGCTLSVASVDVAVNIERCDLMQTSVQQRWLSFIRDGFVCGLGNGPPCETWSVARSQAVEGLRNGGPRPLRDDDQLWGKPDLLAGEAHQVHVGNCLMGFSVRATMAQGVVGGFGYMEHPGDPRHMRQAPIGAASIWHSDVIRKCLELDTFHLLHLCQGHYGGLSAKPTGLLLTGIDSQIADRLAMQGRTTAIPTRSSIGRKDGKWRTSELKTYPPDFCRLLAEMFSSWLTKHVERPRCSIVEEVQWIRDLCIELNTDPAASTAQPDFCQVATASNSKNLFS